MNAPGGANSNNPETPFQASVAAYSQNLEVLVGKLRGTGARLVFATTTPVKPNTINPLREPDAPPRYNKAAKEILEKHHIRINDLFTVCSPLMDKIQQPQNVHFTNAGYDILAAQVASAIQQELKSNK